MNYELCYEEGDYVTMRISDRDDLQYYYDRNEIAKWESEASYYDPSDNTHYESSGHIYDPHHSFNHRWFQRASFEFKNGDPCYLPEQDPSRNDKKPKRRRRSNGDIINFITLGAMSTCSKTKWNEASHPYAFWNDQHPCSFAVKSIENNHCMYWGTVIAGHCSCVEAYAEASGAEFDISRIETIRISDKKREKKSQPVDHHFEEAEHVHIDELNSWYTQRRLKCLRNVNDNSGSSVFYDAEWDVFFNGNGRFLREMTKNRRQHDRVPHDVVNSWAGPISMKRDEVHVEHVCNQLFTDKPNPIDHICDGHPVECPSCNVNICSHNGKHI